MVAGIISQERLTNYLIACGHDRQKAILLYGWNIQISESFYPLLSAVEVCLRNTISTQLIQLYGNHWWDNNVFTNQIQSGGTRIVKTARDKIRRNSRVTSGKMVAELNFGFWVKMLLPRHKNVFWIDFNRSFTDLPVTITYENLFSRCNTVCDFRNRIFHHEPIFSSNITVHYQEIMELIKWLSPAKAIWIKDYCRAMTVLRNKPR